MSNILDELEKRSAAPDHLLENRISRSNVGFSFDSAADEELVAASRRGDDLAFETLVRRHQREVFALAFRYTGAREDAEDVVQQTFEKAFVHLQEFAGESSFSTWLMAVAINQALMLLRRRRTLREVPIDDSNSHEGIAPVLEPADPSPDPEVACSQREGERILCAAIRQLRPGMRRAIELRDLRELSTRETARQMGLSAGALKARLFHARKKLRQALGRYVGPRRLSGNHSSAVSEESI
jgi:RNA polymerase sigma-70 factor (ECF subfamily)